jgi:hypothetical protein
MSEAKCTAAKRRRVYGALRYRLCTLPNSILGMNSSTAGRRTRHAALRGSCDLYLQHNPTGHFCPRKKKDRTSEEARSLDLLTARLALTGGAATPAATLCPRGPVCSKLLRGNLSRGRGLLLRGLHVTTTTAAAAAIAAAIAAVATTVAPLMAAVAAMAAVTAMAAIAAIAVAGAAAAMTKGHRLAVTAQ